MTGAVQRAMSKPRGSNLLHPGVHPDSGAFSGISEDPSVAADTAPRAHSADLAGPILVVDDDPGIRMTVADILSLEGYPVATAANGADALAEIDRNCPSLILLDMRMPILDGWGVARELQHRGLKIPIVVMTAAHNAQKWADEIAADGYVSKPFELVELLDAVGRCRQPRTRER